MTADKSRHVTSAKSKSSFIARSESCCVPAHGGERNRTRFFLSPKSYISQEQTMKRKKLREIARHNQIRIDVLDAEAISVNEVRHMSSIVGRRRRYSQSV